MYSIEHFNERLREEFGERLRLRRSEVRDTTLYVEERTGRGTFTGVAALRDRTGAHSRARADERIRARDGYSKVMEVQLGSRAGCVWCGASYRAPHLMCGEVTCAGCARQTITGFFPSGELLIDYLRERDPERVDQLRRVREESRRAEWLKACEEQSFRNEVGEDFRDTLIEQIPAARLSGATQCWIQD